MVQPWHQWLSPGHHFASVLTQINLRFWDTTKEVMHDAREQDDHGVKDQETEEIVVASVESNNNNKNNSKNKGE